MSPNVCPTTVSCPYGITPEAVHSFNNLADKTDPSTWTDVGTPSIPAPQYNPQNGIVQAARDQPINPTRDPMPIIVVSGLLVFCILACATLVVLRSRSR